MPKLMLLRHAKSDWIEAGLSDMERGLAPRGKRAAQAIGRYMAAKDLAPDLVLCSPARRALDTWQLVAAELTTKPKLRVDDAIYDFGGGEALLESLGRQAGAAQAVLIVGHNPSIEGLAARLAAKGDKRLRSRMEGKFPTGALAVIALDASNWTAIGTGRLVSFTRPKDLLADAGA